MEDDRSNMPWAELLAPTQHEDMQTFNFLRAQLRVGGQGGCDLYSERKSLGAAELGTRLVDHRTTAVRRAAKAAAQLTSSSAVKIPRLRCSSGTITFSMTHQRRNPSSIFNSTCQQANIASCDGWMHHLDSVDRALKHSTLIQQIEIQ